MSKTHNIDLNGLVCPLPVAKTKKKLNELQTGDILQAEGDFVESGENIKRYVEQQGHKVLEFKVNKENYLIKIEKS
jgi:tRNA 2-thiouridine synthesizing protein A